VPGAEQHVFCALYKAGLLGWLEHDMVDGTRRQRFLRPGEGTFEPDGVLPRSTHYLVHPVLSQIIARLNHGYAARIDRVNVVGYRRPWRDPDEPRATALCVLQADVRGMLGLMERGIDAPVRRAIDDAVATHAASARSREVTEGDHVLVTHDDAGLLARTARRILDDVHDAPGSPLLRIALHRGEVRLQESGGTAIVTGGQAIAVAARIEPRVTPGEIWCTEAFRDELARTQALCRTVALVAPPASGGEGEYDGFFNVRKDGSDEADIWVKLYRVEF
jgi:class 3 adenylate cyclase